jgi:hypothetical protein
VTAREHLAVRADGDRVGAALRDVGAPAGCSVGPTDDRWCGVALATGDGATLAAGLGTALGVPVVRATVADELELRLVVWGEELVAYSSAEAGGPADALRWAGAAERLIDATDAPALPADVARVLSGRYPDARSRYADLVAALGLPAYLLTAEWTG